MAKIERIAAGRGGLPAYRQILDTLRSRIVNGDYPVGARMSTPASLARRLSRTAAAFTVALAKLGAAKGIPDRIAVKDGRFYGIEVKAPRGRMSEFQASFRDELVAAGGVYIEARSLDDVMAYF